MTAQIIDFQKVKEQRQDFQLAKEFLSHLFQGKVTDEYVRFVMNEVEKTAQKIEEKPVDKGYSGNKTTGNKYEETKDLDIKEIAKLVRKDIAQAKKEGTLPKNLKVSVKIDRYSMGQSLNVTIKSGLDCPLLNKEWFEQEKNSCGQLPTVERYTTEAKLVQSVLKNIVNSYNYDDCDTMSDYFDVRFYSSIDFDYDLYEQERSKF